MYHSVAGNDAECRGRRDMLFRPHQICPHIDRQSC
jgi:hypothetical protein